MKTMAETPMLPSFSEPITEDRWAVAKFAKTLDSVRLIFLLGHNEKMFFHTIQGRRGPEVRGLRKKDVFARFDNKEEAETAVLRAKIAWDAHHEPVKIARRQMRDAEVARDEAWVKALKESAGA